MEGQSIDYDELRPINLLINAEARIAWSSQWLVVMVAACTGPPIDSGGQEPLIRDSAAIQIVENTEPVLQSASKWTVADSPTVQIGGLDQPRQSLFQVRGALRLPNGQIVVANAGSQQLLFFDSRGAAVRAVGGDGEGPGEFKGLDWLALMGTDSLVAYDWRLARVSVLDTAGGLARVFQLSGPADLGTLRVIGNWGNERLLLVRQGQTFNAGSATSGVYGDSLLALAFDVEGGLTDTLGMVPTTQRFVASSERSLAVISLPFGRSPALATYRGGFWLGASERWEVEWRGLDGALLRLTRTALTAQPVDPSDIRRERQRVLDDTPENRRTTLRRILDQDLPWPHRMPAYDALVVAEDGDLWVREFVPSWEPATRWIVLEPGGGLKAIAQASRNLDFVQVLGDEVLAIRQDQYGVEYVGLYPIDQGS